MRFSLVRVTLLLAVAIVGCVLGTDPHERMVVGITSSADRLVLGEPVAFTVAAFNPTGDTLRIELGSCALQFEVLDSAGHVVAPENLSCPLILWSGVVGPGDSMVTTFTWRGDRMNAVVDDYLDPGSYQIRGILDLINGRVVSEPLTFELQAP